MPLRQEFGSLLLQHRQQGTQGGCAVADQVDFHRVAQTDTCAVNIDLHPPCAPRFRQEFAVRERGPDHQQRVASLHHVPGRFGAEQTDASRNEGKVVRNRCLAKQGLGYPGLQFFGDRDHLISCRERAGPDEDSRFFACVQYRCGSLEMVFGWQQGGIGIADTGVGRAMNQWRVLVTQTLKVIGEDHTCDCPLGAGDPNGAIDEMTHLARHTGHCHEVCRYVFEQRRQIHFLLVVCTKRTAGLLSDDGNDRHMIHLRIIKTVQQVNRTGTGGRVTKPDLAGEFGVG